RSESYWDGSAEVIGTTFVDDCQWDRSAEYTDYRTVISNVTNGTLDISEGYAGRMTKSFNAGDFFLSVDYYLPNDNASLTLAFSSDVNNIRIDDGNKYLLYKSSGSVNMRLYRVVGGNYTLISDNITGFVVGSWGNLQILKVGSSIKLYLNGVETVSATDSTHTSGCIGIGTYTPQIGTTSYRNLVIIAAESTSTNGIAACIPPIGGGARYGVQEEVYHTYTNEVRKGKYLVSTCVKTTNADADAIEMYLENTTDSTAITEDASKTVAIALTDTNYMDVEKEMKLGYADRGDTLKVAVRKTDAATEVSPACFVEMLNVTPTIEVI
ncbi:MAG: DUF1080 domain-containing protein, partial [Bacilli bacterium]|nr:DUF1080 domain-containing protein [Bacilli bacterium]